MTRRKGKTPEQVAAEQRQLRRQRAGLIRDAYPNMTLIEFNFTYSDPEGHNFKEKAVTMAPDKSALFEFDCPTECVGGFADLGGFVREMVQHKQTEATGRHVCHAPGNVRRVRASSGRCLTTAEYNVRVSYTDDD